MKRVELYSLVCGAVFLTSGFAKALYINDFSSVIIRYGFDVPEIAAAVVVLVETLLGLWLIFRLWLRTAAGTGIVLTASLTLVYLYGIAFRGIDDCGCFGRIEILNTSATLSLVRNALLIIMLIRIRQLSGIGEREPSRISSTAWLLMCAVTSLVAFISGHNLRKSNGTEVYRREDQATQAVVDTPLKEFLTTCSDSTYLVFAFSYRCPHCLNSIENLKQYESSAAIDRVIGLVVEDSAAELRFREAFHPKFPIRHFPPDKLFRLTNAFPRAWYVRHDSVVMVLSGTLPCIFLFEHELEVSGLASQTRRTP